MIILNSGPVPVRVAGRWLQPGEAMPVENLEVAYRLMEANPNVVESGKPENKPMVSGQTEQDPGVWQPGRPSRRKK